MPNRPRKGAVIIPGRVVAPISVKRGSVSLTERAEGPCPIIRSSSKSSIAG